MDRPGRIKKCPIILPLRKLPACLATPGGKGGGKLKTGSHVKYTLGAGPGAGVDGRGNRADTQTASLHLTALHAFGINDPTFGHDDMGPIASTTLSEIQAWRGSVRPFRTVMFGSF